MIRQVVKAARAAGIPVAVCGEMAGDPLSAFILLGLGVDDLSMSPWSMPVVKNIIRSVSMKEAKSDLRRILQLDTASKVREFVSGKMGNLLADVGDASEEPYRRVLKKRVRKVH
jgi:phosphotransferase system enzyme I (PtsI)